MKTNKLFNVLVLGGLALTGSSVFAQETGIVSTLPQEPLQQLLCNAQDPNKCVPGESGKLEPIKGFFCCWGTSCEKK